MTPPRARLLLAALPLLLAACAGPSVPSTSVCSVDSQCKPGFSCSAERVCAPAATPDAGHDAGTDGGSDGGSDGGADAGPAQGKLTVTPATRAVSAVINTPSTTTFSLGNTGTAALNAGITCTSGAIANPTTATVTVGAAPSVAVALPSFAAAGTQTFVCTVQSTDPPDAPFSDVLETERSIALRQPIHGPYATSIRKIRDSATSLFGNIESDANYHFAVAAIGLRLMQAVDLSDIARARITASALWAVKAFVQKLPG